ncbi:MAG: peptidylprolyl isomerase [Elusimicrobia bacterium]|nr:peptidylprolyl isomerase [Elusimicrobiota bacterium]
MTVAALAGLLGWAAAWSAAPGLRLADERLLLRTVGGDVVVGLYADAAPEHVSRLLKLARLGVYDSAHFFRVAPGAEVQVSEVEERSLPLSPEQASAVAPLPDAADALPPLRGSVVMAPGARTSFSILLADRPRAKGRAVVVGRVESGLDVLEGFLVIPRDEHGRPAARLELIALEPVFQEELDRRRLAPARSAAPAAPGRPWTATAGLFVLVLVSAAGWLVRDRFPRAAASLFLVNVLVGVFLLVAVLLPWGSRPDPFLGTALFLALLGLLTLMTRFET